MRAQASRASSLGPRSHSMVEGSEATSPFERTGNAAALQRSKTANFRPRMPPRYQPTWAILPIAAVLKPLKGQCCRQVCKAAHLMCPYFAGLMCCTSAE